MTVSTQVPAGGPVSPVDARGRDGSYVGFAALVAVAVLVVLVIGSLVFRNPGPTASHGPPATRPRSPSTVPVVTRPAQPSDLALVDPRVAVDDFSGPSVGGLSDFPKLGPYQFGGGTWSTAGGRGVLLASDRVRPSLAWVRLPSPDVEAQVLLAVPVQSAGVAFRVRDADNFWLWLAAPQYGTCILMQVTDGKGVRRGSTGPIAMGPDFALGVHVVGSAMDLLVDGRVVLRVVDPSPRPGSGVGLGALPGAKATAFDQLAVIDG